MATTEKGIYYPNDYAKPADVPNDMKKLAESVDTQISNLDTNKVDKVDGKGLSTNDFTNEDKEKLDGLENYDDTEITQEIEDIQEEQTKQNEDIEDLKQINAKQDDLIQKLKDNSINVTTEEATSLHVENASTVPAKLEVRGNCKQETRSEKNLYNVNDCSDKSSFASVDDDDWITLQLKSAQSVQLYLNYLMNYSEKIKTSSTYYLVIEIKEFSGTGSLVVSQYLDSSKSQISTPISLDFSSLTTGKRKYTVSTINDFTDVKWMIRTFASFPTGSFGKIVFRLSLLEEEPDLDTFVYQKYGASPSLDYPSPVRAVGDNVNMSDKDNINKILATPSNLTVIASSSGGASFYLKAKPNTAYTISREVLGQRFVASTSVEVPAVGTSLTQTIINNDGDAIHIKTSKNDNYLLVYYLYNNTENEEEILSSIKIEEGTEATSYSPYGQGSVEIKKINKNWAKIDTPRTVERGGLSITLDDEDVFTINGTTTSNIYINLINITEYQNTTLTNYKLPLKNYKAYFDLISKNNSAVSESNGDVSFNIRNFGASATGESAITYCVFGSLIKGNTGVQIKDCNITEDRVVAYLYVPSGVKLDNFKFRFALYNEDEPDTTYVKHEEQSRILPIQKPMLQGDYFVKESDGWKEVHHFYKFIATASAGEWEETKDWKNRYKFDGQLDISNRMKSLDNTNQFCSHSNECFNLGLKIGTFQVRSTAGFYFTTDKFNSNEEFNQFIAEQEANGTPLTFWFEAKEYELDCTKEQSAVLDKLEELELFKGTNNIITAESLALIQMQYIADTVTYIDNRIDEKLANINQQILEISGGK